MIYVYIAISPTQYESWDWVLLNDQSFKRYCDWFLERKIEYDYEFVKCLIDGVHCHVFGFNDYRDALLFKLTWGGL